jgi:hypothetical protein
MKKNKKVEKKKKKEMHCGLQYNAWVWVNNEESYNASLTYCNQLNIKKIKLKKIILKKIIKKTNKKKHANKNCSNQQCFK